MVLISTNEFRISLEDCDLLTIAFTSLILSLMALKFELKTLVRSSSLRSACLQLSPVALVTSALISSTNVSLDSSSTTELLSLGLVFRFHFSPLIAVSLRVIFRGSWAGRPTPTGVVMGEDIGSSPRWRWRRAHGHACVICHVDRSGDIPYILVINSSSLRSVGIR